MALTTETAHRGSAIRIHHVRCRPHSPACGPVESAATDLLVFPLRGVFVKHYGRGERLVADPCHAVFFRAGEPYRVSHPVNGGDECLVVEPAPELLALIPSQQKFVALDGRLIATRKLLWHRLQRRIAGPLEAEETALDLLCGINQADSPTEPSSSRARHREMVEAAKIMLAGRPGETWTLAGLAKRVYSSPFRLARIFRRLTGLPLHRYHLRARMAAALDEVLDTSRDLTAIGLELGFSSHSHFTATFRRTFGVTPSVLRKGKNLTAR